MGLTPRPTIAGSRRLRPGSGGRQGGSELEIKTEADVGANIGILQWRTPSSLVGQILLDRPQLGKGNFAREWENRNGRRKAKSV